MAKDLDPQEELNEEQGLYEHYRIEVDPGQSPLRIDKFLMSKIENATRTKIQAAAKAGNIFVNQKTVKQNYKVKPNDLITILLTKPPREIELIPQDIPLNILYEDDDVVLVNKEPGMVVHPAFGHFTGTLVNAIIHHFGQMPSRGDDDIRPGLVHRIDKDTSGLLVLAKNEVAQNHLAKQFFDHTITRKYQALVWGDFQEDEGTITGHIGRSVRDRKVMDVYPDGDFGKHAVTHYKVLERFGYITLVECQLETGRTHQIRAHMKYAGHPLFNDATYGGDSVLKGTTFAKYKQFVQNCFSAMPRQALHAKSLGFVHPGSGEQIHFESELPEDFKTVIEKWRRYTAGSTAGE